MLTFRLFRSSDRLPLFWIAAAALLGGVYLLYTRIAYDLAGFPLDDAWIHQTYARNLGILGQWVFQPGEVSAGSTAPLWSILLALGYRLGISYLMWTYSLGVLALGVNAWLAARLSSRLLPGRPFIAWLAGMACLTQWQLVWAAVSGMETLLFSGLGLELVYLVTSDWQPSSDNQHSLERHARAVEQVSRPRRYFVAGLLAGMMVLTRPEGLLLVGLAALILTWQLRRELHQLVMIGALFGIGVALPLLPYLAFHFIISGHPFPNTLYAKQKEYQVLLELYPLEQRWLMVVQTAMIGGQVLLLPGFLFAIGHALFATRGCAEAWGNSRRVTVLLLAGWCFAHLTLYAWQLPLTYQHGRYQMPVLAAFLVVGVVGSVMLRDVLGPGMARRIAERTALVACAVINLVFLSLGGRAYAQDVGFVEGEMVTIARWLAANTPEDSLIAVHDIGAVGYFAGRRLLDLAGLITPEVIPIMDDEAALLHFIETRDGRYIVFFPDWSPAYRRMAQDARLESVFSSGYTWTRAQGRENMHVYRLRNALP
ncbi:MAG: hypothetical protein ACP5R2_09905 [Anaerolineae bacterium]